MPESSVLDRGEFVMTVCNSCRYCEQYCPVFPAMERRTSFAAGDLAYLANLCHNCGECLYACQYAPPHEFGINVPKMLAEVRVHSYESYCWPGAFGAAFRHNSVSTALGLVAVFAAVLLGAGWVAHGEDLWRATAGDFYSVVPHDVMIALFGSVGAFVLLAFGVGLRRFWRDVHADSVAPSPTAARRALGDLLTLRHLHTTGVDCTSGVETRSPWRRWFHHCTFYGFMLCFASTSVAAIYDGVFGWIAPYGYASLPVVLGTVGGLGLLVGPVGLLAIRRSRDPELGDAEQTGMDESFIVLLLVTSATGIALLLLRNQPAMGALLMVHLGAVLALFVTLPYGKFVHGLYRTAALLKYASESEAEERQ